jgi:hypothetical protein
MDYSYLFEKSANTNVELRDIFKAGQMNILHILCYHINNEAKYPFIQFMIEKIPYCGGLIKEQFTLPYILYPNLSKSIEEMVLEKTQIALRTLQCKTDDLNENMYKGIVMDKSDKYYALINITGIDISGLNLSRNSETWFCLPSEIINQEKICNIDVDEDLIELFTDIPELSLLTDVKKNICYMLPDVVYTGGEKKTVEFNGIFGKPKTQEYKNSGKYYYFYRSFKDVIKEGGWIKEGGDRLIDKSDNNMACNEAGRLIIENDYGKYINGGINRYALFVEGKIYIETEEEFSLDDKTIEELYADPCLIIAYIGKNNKPNIQVKEYNSFYPLSNHCLNKDLLGESFINSNSNLYMIQ